MIYYTSITLITLPNSKINSTSTNTHAPSINHILSSDRFRLEPDHRPSPKNTQNPHTHEKKSLTDDKRRPLSAESGGDVRVTFPDVSGAGKRNVSSGSPSPCYVMVLVWGNVRIRFETNVSWHIASGGLAGTRGERAIRFRVLDVNSSIWIRCSVRMNGYCFRENVRIVCVRLQWNYSGDYFEGIWKEGSGCFWFLDSTRPGPRIRILSLDPRPDESGCLEFNVLKLSLFEKI